MKKLILTLFFVLTICTVNAFHIVGGEMEFIYVSDGIYRINVIQYFDEAQTENPGPEAQVIVYIFRNGDDQLMSTHELPLQVWEDVDYTNIDCVIDQFETSRAVWSADIEFDPNNYSDENGYYIVWERCCRSSYIKNIINPSGSGMKYTLEFPPMTKDGLPFVNSSPVLFKPLRDYACVDQLFYAEFTGTDNDGDSLVYSLDTPLNSSANVALPTPQPKPHFDVLFAKEFSLENMIPGSSPLSISNEGLITVTPSQTGLFVFSVLVEEYRDQKKIGEVRRDFQMLVVDGCEPIGSKPIVDIELSENPNFDPTVDTLHYLVTASNCFDFSVSNLTPGERISFTAKGVNFKGDLDEIFSSQNISITDENELSVEVCLPMCPPLKNEAFIVDLIAFDDFCPLPLLDTIRLTVKPIYPPEIKDDTDIVSFQLKQQTGAAIIDPINHSIVVEAALGTDLSKLAPTFELSEEATASPSSGDTINFSVGPVVYTVTADYCSIQEWTITINEELNFETDFLTFMIDEQVSEPIINKENHTIEAIVNQGSDLTNLSPIFVLSDGASSDPVSETAVNFTRNPFSYMVTSEDTENTQEWMVNVIAEEEPLIVKNVKDFSVWPNPTSRFLNVNTSKEGVTVRLVNMAGQLVLPPKNGDSFKLDLQFLNPGLYLLAIDNGQSSFHYSIIKN